MHDDDDDDDDDLSTCKIIPLRIPRSIRQDDSPRRSRLQGHAKRPSATLRRSPVAR